jgi:hypothetical protein
MGILNITKYIDYVDISKSLDNIEISIDKNLFVPVKIDGGNALLSSNVDKFYDGGLANDLIINYELDGGNALI